MESLKNYSVSHGTVRTQDLLVPFAELLYKLNPAVADVLFVYKSLSNIKSLNDDSDYWYSDEAISLMDCLFDELDQSAPNGYYFGAHPGDGSDFGFWELDDEIPF